VKCDATARPCVSNGSGMIGHGSITAGSDNQRVYVDDHRSVLVVRGAASHHPAPTTIGEHAHGGISHVQDSWVCAVAVEVWRGILGLEGTVRSMEGLTTGMRSIALPECVLRPAARPGMSRQLNAEVCCLP